MFIASHASRCRLLVGSFIALSFAGCGGSPQAPSQNPPAAQAPTVTAISPASGSTIGGTNVTITGSNFAAGAAVTIGGAAATNVAVQSATSITATTAQRPSGAGDVVVTVNGRTATLPGAFTYTAPQVQVNTPPVISSFTAQDQRPGTPRNFADLNSVVNVTAIVQDAETPLPQLTYEWTAGTGAFEGSGPALRWRAPAQFSTPADVRLTLTVIERYDSVNDQGLPTTAEHRVSGNVTVSLHDSRKEIADLGHEFLVDFSLQRPPDVVVRNFSDSCRGKSEERNDVVDNQAKRTIVDYSIGAPDVTVNFGAVCPYFASRGRLGDGCAWYPARWRSVEKADGRTTNTNGFDQVNALFQNGRWQLCDSDFNGTVTANGVPTNIRFKK